MLKSKEYYSINVNQYIIFFHTDHQLHLFEFYNGTCNISLLFQARFLSLLKKFYGSIDDLHCCVSAVQQSESLIHIHISTLDYFSIHIIRVLSKVPGAIYRSLLVIYFIYSSMSPF